MDFQCTHCTQAASCCIPPYLFGYILSRLSPRLSFLIGLQHGGSLRRLWRKKNLTYRTLSSSLLLSLSAFSNAGLTPPWSQSFHCHASGNLTMSFRANDRRCSSNLGRPRHAAAGARNNKDCKGICENYLSLINNEIDSPPRSILERR